MPTPIGDNIVIVPVAIAHVGWARFAVGKPGVGGCASIVTIEEDIHPSAFIAVIVYGPDNNPLNIKPDWKAPPIL